MRIKLFHEDDKQGGKLKRFERTMNKKNCMLLFASIITMLLLVMATASADDPLKVSMTLSETTFTEPKEVMVSISITNIGEKDMPSSVRLYDPDGYEIEEFGSPILKAGETVTWSGIWNVTLKQLNIGRISYKVRYSVYGEEIDSEGNPEVVTKAKSFSKKISFEGPNAIPKVIVNRTINPLSASTGQKVEIIYEIINAGQVDVSSIRIFENESVAGYVATLDKVKAGESQKYSFTVQMEDKDLISSGFVAYFAGGTTYTQGTEEEVIKHVESEEAGTISEVAPENPLRAGDWEYYLLSDGTAEIAGYVGKEINIEVPQYIAGSKVSSIGAMAFSFCFGLKEVMIPSGIVSIANNAFQYCDSLTKINIPDTVITIGDNAFSSCASLQEINVPEGIVSIGDYAFSDCLELVNISLPDSLNYLGNNPFLNCNDNISINFNYPHNYLLRWQGGLFSISDKRMIWYSRSSVFTDLRIPDGTITIGDNAFTGCKAVNFIYLPDTIKTIGNSAFSGCESLEQIGIPDSVEKIGFNPFMGCTKLERIKISPDHKNFAIIDGAMFRKKDKSMICFPCANKAVSYEIPYGITKIGRCAFYHCDSLKDLSIPDSVLDIEEYAFAACSTLESVEISQNLRKINNYIFYGCESLRNVHIPEGIESIGTGSFYGCSSLEEIIIPESVKTIEKRAFQGCVQLRKVSLPSSIINIKDNTFAYCEKLDSISLPENIEEIGSHAFDSCFALQSIYIPASVKKMGYGVFYGCKSITVSVERESYAQQYCELNYIDYTYPDANEWLNK